MNSLIWIAIIFSPFIMAELYFAVLQRKSRKAIQNYQTEDSQLFADLKVWFKNYDVTKRKNKITTSAFDTLYSFNECDLILGDASFLLVGKLRFMGFARKLYPTAFVSDSSQTSNIRHSRITVVYGVKMEEEDLEIEFEDNRYTNRIILVIKQPDQDLVEHIIDRFGN